METGALGSLGAHALLLVEEGNRPGHGNAIIHSHPTMGVLVLETHLRYPGVTLKLAQVSNQTEDCVSDAKKKNKLML